MAVSSGDHLTTETGAWNSLAALVRSGFVGLLTAAFAGFAFAQSKPSVATPPLELRFTSVEVHATGSWVTRVNRGGIPISPVNAVEIRCQRASMSCWESRAELGHESRPARQSTEAQQLGVVHLGFTVTEWTEARITARSDTPSGDLMLRILPAERLVRLSYWDARPDNNRKDAPNGYLWELQ